MRKGSKRGDRVDSRVHAAARGWHALSKTGKFMRRGGWPIEHIDEAGCPLLIIAGSEDEHTTLAESQRSSTARRSRSEC